MSNSLPEKDALERKIVTNLNGKQVINEKWLEILYRIDIRISSVENRLSNLEKKFSILEHRICDDDLK